MESDGAEEEEEAAPGEEEDEEEEEDDAVGKKVKGKKSRQAQRLLAMKQKEVMKSNSSHGRAYFSPAVLA